MRAWKWIIVTATVIASSGDALSLPKAEQFPILRVGAETPDLVDLGVVKIFNEANSPVCYAINDKSSLFYRNWKFSAPLFDDRMNCMMCLKWIGRIDNSAFLSVFSLSKNLRDERFYHILHCAHNVCVYEFGVLDDIRSRLFSDVFDIGLDLDRDLSAPHPNFVENTVGCAIKPYPRSLVFPRERVRLVGSVEAISDQIDGLQTDASRDNSEEGHEPLGNAIVEGKYAPINALVGLAVLIALWLLALFCAYLVVDWVTEFGHRPHKKQQGNT